MCIFAYLVLEKYYLKLNSKTEEIFSDKKFSLIVDMAPISHPFSFKSIFQCNVLYWIQIWSMLVKLKLIGPPQS